MWYNETNITEQKKIPAEGNIESHSSPIPIWPGRGGRALGVGVEGRLGRIKGGRGG